MAMERFFTALVFCEAPLDGYGTSVLTAGTVKRLVSGGGDATKPLVAIKPDAEKGQGFFTGKQMAQRRAGFELAFDGLNCFDTVVMH
ncbi:hypothetical protein CFC21_095709 [Triticum aestivum]|uniref:Uncharacterized protein n=2 Tax=Triticum aestivum TaxID=4565 RepID=A0A1D6C0Q8_WHEAT|nr:uncharacterized protein LOC119330668 [Triticum dicoccoides]XP_037470264.1 uncharacterized protein LOC119343409 [Triticum dicoccoides]XP_037470746.1 uncharacterized protein LOC119344398 [Triticum dicoccoides]XP_044426300.1 uncharacterized protein LOC123150524 [Triticum aestivum]XP_044426304.1 uncharacterized protein LOC123150528 [Triticum aestivum]KAF7093282.1 hypothetical protein CFC21_095704 [Triticum aestivum]KAF7093283.1 hypothetical protein CFC21_095705 [Triticum aestivum]KAF7093284.1